MSKALETAGKVAQPPAGAGAGEIASELREALES
jgi:hypothetical protein